MTVAFVDGNVPWLRVRLTDDVEVIREAATDDSLRVAFDFLARDLRGTTRVTYTTEARWRHDTLLVSFGPAVPLIRRACTIIPHSVSIDRVRVQTPAFIRDLNVAILQGSPYGTRAASRHLSVPARVVRA